MTSFHPLSDSLEVHFTCPHCKNEALLMVYGLPSPDWSGDTASSSENYDDVDFYCDHCGHSYTMDIFVNIIDGEIVITDNDTHEEIADVNIKEHYREEEEVEVTR